MKKVKLDRINKAILKALQENAKVSNLELAEIVNLSTSACFQRTKLLEEAGYIRKYVATVDIDALCEHVMAYLYVTLRDQTPHRKAVFEQLVWDYDEIIDCLKVDGPHHYTVLLCCSTTSDLNELIDSLLERDENIRLLESSIVLSKTKWFSGYPLNKLKWKENS